MPSVFYLTLGKVTIKSGRCALVCRVFWRWHSAKFRNIAECFGIDTRQSLETLPSVFPSCTRQKRRHRAIPLTFFCREFIFAECLLTLGKLFAECAIKNTRQITVCRQNNAVCCMSSVTLGKAFAECPWHSAKLLYPVVLVGRQNLGLLVHSPKIYTISHRIFRRMYGVLNID